MNINDYISSGILEAYVLGKTTEGETLEVERLVREHPEVRAELEAIEEALEALAMSGAVAPSPSVLDNIHQKLDGASAVPTAKVAAPPKRSWGNMGLWAGLALSVVALLLIFFDRQQLVIEKEQIQNELNQLRENCEETRTQLTRNNAVLAAIADPLNSKSVPLTATEAFPGSTAHLFINPAQEVALFDPLSLPQPPSGQQYQLWGIVDGQPRSMGIIDPEAQAGDLLQMEYLQNVELYAVTLEPRGGSEAPTLEKMYVKS